MLIVDVDVCVGSCPVENGGTFTFPIPKSAASGAALFAW